MVARVCHKPKVKCGECPSREFKEYDTQAVYDHLSGAQVVGVYPPLPDDSCFFLAVDFDKSGWKAAVGALDDVCRNYSIPFGVEVSRSGDGVHLWIFFSESVPAREARKLGFGLLDQAMDVYPELSFDAYYRLFPNQDSMPQEDLVI